MATEPASATEDRCSSLVEVIFCCAIKSMFKSMEPSVQKYGSKCSKVWIQVFKGMDPCVWKYGSRCLKVWFYVLKVWTRKYGYKSMDSWEESMDSWEKSMGLEFWLVSNHVLKVWTYIKKSMDIKVWIFEAVLIYNLVNIIILPTTTLCATEMRNIHCQKEK